MRTTSILGESEGEDNELAQQARKRLEESYDVETPEQSPSAAATTEGSNGSRAQQLVPADATQSTSQAPATSNSAQIDSVVTKAVQSPQALQSVGLSATQMDWLMIRPDMEKLYDRARKSQLAHYVMAKRYKDRGDFVGNTATIVAALAGASGLTQLTGGWGVWGTVLTLFLGMATALLTQLQTRVKYSETSTEHRIAAAGYAALRRLIRVEAPLTRGESGAFMDKVREKYDELTKQSPDTDDDAWDKAKKKYGKDPDPLIHRPIPGREEDWLIFNKNRADATEKAMSQLEQEQTAKPKHWAKRFTTTFRKFFGTAPDSG